MAEVEPSSLRLDTVTRDDRTVVFVCGVVDSLTAPQLGAVIDAIAEDVTTIELDVAELRFLDSTGIGVLASALQRLDGIDGQLELRNVPPSMMRLLRITALLPMVSVLSEQ